MEDFTLGPVHLKAWHITLRCMLEEFHWMMWHNRHIWGLPVCIYPTTQHNTLIYCMLKTVVMRPVTVTGQRHSPPDSTVVVEPVRVRDLKTLERLWLCGPECHTQHRHWSNVMDAWCKHGTRTFPEPSLGVVWVHKYARLRSYIP